MSEPQRLPPEEVEPGPDAEIQDRPVDYRARIPGQPGTGAAEFFRILAFVEGIAGVLLAFFLFEQSFVLAVGVAIAGATSAALCYSLAVIIENVIAIRMELEFQSEVMEEEDGSPTAGYRPGSEVTE